MIKNLNQKIEKLFDQSLDTVSLEELKKSFILNRDNNQLEHLSYVFNKTAKLPELKMLFSQLASFFEIGFCFERQTNQLNNTIQMFAFSSHIQNLENLASIRLPEADVFHILSTSTTAFLKKFNLSQLDHQKKLQAFLIPISKKYSFVVLTSLAEPWAQLRLESLQKTLMKIPFEL